MITAVVSLFLTLSAYTTDLEYRCMGADIKSLAWSDAVQCTKQLMRSPDRRRTERACLIAEELNERDFNRSVTELPESIDYCF